MNEGLYFLLCSLIYGLTALAIAFGSARRPWRLLPLLRAAWRWKREAIKARREYMRECLQRTLYERIAWGSGSELRRQIECNEHLHARLKSIEAENAELRKKLLPDAF